jgi:hypothetical protein
LTNRTEVNEMLKIFPSASDVAFASRKGIANHRVYPPYKVLTHPTGTVITNPKFSGLQPTAPSLRFEILNARPDRGGTAQVLQFLCDMVAFANDVELWTHSVTAVGDGPFGNLRW